jgi:tetratricopeptide (TPR) repeat protein
MAVNSEYNFVGGYENDSKGGLLHVADHHISPGKKQWTWGNGDFGIAWDRNLTDEDGPYIELMTGVYTDNQPDFTWLQPNEEKSFTQYFMPYREVGLVKNATKDLIVGLECIQNDIHIKVFATSNRDEISISVSKEGELIFAEKATISPEKIYQRVIASKSLVKEKELTLVITDKEGNELISYRPQNHKKAEIPKPARPAKLPEEAVTNEELFLTGQHLEQYRHATYSPVPYYKEALRRDETDIRNNNALGVWYLRRGRFAESENFFRRAISSITRRNPNPYDSEPYYNLGLSLQYQGKTDDSYDAFFKATWSSAWQDSAYFEVARIDTRRGHYDLGLEHINWSLDRNARNGKAYLVKVHCLWKLGQLSEAIEVAQSALRRDAFNQSVRYELSLCYVELGDQALAEKTVEQLIELTRCVGHTLIETSIEFAALGRYDQAIELLLHVKNIQSDPMVNYYLGYYWHKLGDKNSSASYLKTAAAAEPGITFPNRLEDILVLEHAIKNNPQDAKALYYLGNLWYDKRQYNLAITNWERSADIDKNFPTVFRNLGIAAFNKQNNPDKALKYFERAFALDTSDARVLMELDQLYKRLNHPAETRLKLLTRHIETANIRDDVYLEIASLKNLLGNYDDALRMVMNKKFHPWEGGEGKVSGQYIFSLVELAKEDIRNQKLNSAIDKLTTAQTYPVNLGEGKLPGAQENDIDYWLGVAFSNLGNRETAILHWKKATVGLSEPSAAMFYNDQQPDKIFYQGLAWEKLGDIQKANEIFDKLIRFANDHKDDDNKIDYFAVSLPDLLIFEDDLKKRNQIHCSYIAGLGYLGKKDYEEAEKFLLKVLSSDASHHGALAHLHLLKEFKEASFDIVAEK